MGWWIVGGVLAAAIFSFTPVLRHFADVLTTIAHEMGHVIASFLSGGRVSFIKGVKVYWNNSAEAFLALPIIPGLKTFSNVVSSFAGYAAPIWAAMLLYAVPATNLWTFGWVALTVMVGAFTILARSLLAFVYALMSCGILYVTWHYGGDNSPLTVSIFCFFATVFLLRGSIDIKKSVGWAFKQPEVETDFVLLSQRVFGTPPFWAVLFLVWHGILWGAITVFVLLPPLLSLLS